MTLTDQLQSDISTILDTANTATNSQVFEDGDQAEIEYFDGSSATVLLYFNDQTQSDMVWNELMAIGFQPDEESSVLVGQITL